MILVATDSLKLIGTSDETLIPYIPFPTSLTRQPFSTALSPPILLQNLR